MSEAVRLRWDAAVYAVGALVAAVVVASDRIPIQRQWGRMALGPYVLAAVLAAALSLAWRRKRTSAWPLRAALLLGVVAGVAVVPLVLQVRWRDAEGFRGHVQAEVLVVEASAEALLHGRNPYATSFEEGPLRAWPEGTAEHVPYLPGTFAFGLPRAIGGRSALTDARLAFLGAGALALATAAALARAPAGRLLTALVLMLALPMWPRNVVGGGTDAPVLGLLLLALSLLHRGRPGWAGVVAGAAAAMKQIAWPLLPFLVACARDRDGRAAAGTAAVAMGAVVVPVVAPFALRDPRAFVRDAVLFPLGLAEDPTLARGPTIGMLLSEVLPWSEGTLALVALAVVLAAALLLLARGPTDARGGAERGAIVLLLAILLATAGRPGYLVYPIALLAWSRSALGPSRGGDPASVPDAHV